MVRLTLLQIFLLWVVGFGGLSLWVRRWIAIFADRVLLWLPPAIKYYIVATPVILLEEALTIEVPNFWGVLPIVLAFYIMFLPVYLFQRYTECSFWLASSLFGVLGCYNEFILVGRIHQMDGLVLFIMCTLCFLIHVVMALLPSYYLQFSIKRSGNQRY